MSDHRPTVTFYDRGPTAPTRQRWFWTLRAGNHRVVISSWPEAFSTRSGARRSFHTLTDGGTYTGAAEHSETWPSADDPAEAAP